MVHFLEHVYRYITSSSFNSKTCNPAFTILLMNVHSASLTMTFLSLYTGINENKQIGRRRMNWYREEDSCTDKSTGFLLISITHTHVNIDKVHQYTTGSYAK